MCETCGCDHLIDGITHEEMHALGIAHEHGRHHSENRNSREHLVEQNILSENNLRLNRYLYLTWSVLRVRERQPYWRRLFLI